VRQQEDDSEEQRMNCPACGESNAYQGLTVVECLNTACKYYSAKWAADQVHPSNDVTVEPLDYPLPVEGTEYEQSRTGMVYWVVGEQVWFDGIGGGAQTSMRTIEEFAKDIAAGEFTPTGNKRLTVSGGNHGMLTSANALVKPKRMRAITSGIVYWIEKGRWVCQRAGSTVTFDGGEAIADVEDNLKTNPHLFEPVND
jgi:hypothetical protein